MKNTIFSLLCAVFFGFFSTNGWAAPAINSVSGTIGHNQSVTISGSGFGSKPKPSPILWDTVDNIPSYSGLSDGATIPMGGSNPWPSPYGNSSGGNHVKYETSDSQRGVSTAMYKASNQVMAYLDGLTWTATNYVYVSWWWKPATSFLSGDHSSKILRMSNSSNETTKTFSWTQMHNYIWNDPNYCGIEWENWNGNINNWNFIEAWFNSADRTYVLRINGSVLTSHSWSSCSASNFNELWKIGFDGGGTSPPSLTWWMDDIYVDSSFARIMLGNASTYAASTHFEMQVPTAWSNSSVSVKVNTGAFAANQQAYLYVVDANGNINSQGYPITIGGGGARGALPPAQDNPPSAPSGLRIIE